MGSPRQQKLPSRASSSFSGRGFDGEENENGTPFVDYRTNLRTTQNTIVYGHNMRTGTMFETLLQYRDMNFYKEHPTLTFDSVYEEGEYKVIGMFIANTRPEDGPIFDYLNFLDGTEETFMEYVENVREQMCIRDRPCPRQSFRMQNRWSRRVPSSWGRQRTAPISLPSRVMRKLSLIHI